MARKKLDGNEEQRRKMRLSKDFGALVTRAESGPPPAERVTQRPEDYAVLLAPV